MTTLRDTLEALPPDVLDTTLTSAASAGYVGTTVTNGGLVPSNSTTIYVYPSSKEPPVGQPVKTREAEALKDGLPRSAYAYAPSPQPGTWKLPIYMAAGAVDEERLPAAVASLSPGGFRGQKADIPAADLPMVKAKLRSAYRKWKGSAAEYPDTIREAYFGGSCLSCNHPTACDCCECDCGAHVSESLADVTNALDVLEDLYVLVDGEMRDGDIEGADLIQTAIDAVLKFLPVEGREMRKMAAAGSVTESEVVAAFFTEVGKRNAAGDQKMIQAIHDHSHNLGAVHEPGKEYGGMVGGGPMRESIVVDGGASAEAIRFTEASDGDGLAFVTLAEAAATFDDATRTVTITPIRPGFGNKRDKFYYPADTLREATGKGLFNNLKMFRNHPRKSDEKELPERDVRDWFATTREATWDESRQVPRLPVVVHDEADYRRWKEAPEQIAFSVLGGGMARPGKVNGQDARIVESFSNLRSVDWVTEAGAGGAIAFAESAAEDFDMDIKSLSTEQLKEELRLREAATEAPEAESATEDKAEVVNEAPPVESPEQPEATAAPAEEVPPAPAEAPAAEQAPAGYVTREEFEALRKMLDDAKVKESQAKVVRSVIAESTLPKAAKDVVFAKFSESTDPFEGDRDALIKAVEKELADAERMLRSTGRVSNVTGLGATSGGDDIRESIAARISAKWGVEQMPTPEKTVILPGEQPVAESSSTDDVEASAVEARMAAKFGL